jgi:hypothetical protein
VKVYLLAAMAALAVGMGVSSVRAVDVIYQDNFDGTGGDLGARAVTVASGLDGGTAAATWNAALSSTNAPTITATTADASWTATGGTYTGTGTTSATIGVSGASGADANLIANADLPFSPQSGFVYDLHAAIEVSSAGASGNWLGLAYATTGLNTHSVSGASSAPSNDNPFGLLITKGSNVVQDFGGVGTANGSTGGTATAGQFNNFDVILDTTGAAWKMSWLINGSPAGSYTYTSNPSIGLVLVGANKLNGAVSDFSLTATPEPASLGLLSAGAVGLLARRRRR